MRKLMLLATILVGLGQGGCAFLGGAALGAAGTSVAYEVNAHNQMEKLDSDYGSERISRREYENRKRQIEAGSILY